MKPKLVRPAFRATNMQSTLTSQRFDRNDPVFPNTPAVLLRLVLLFCIAVTPWVASDNGGGVQVV